jgi:hypothetical protein
VLVGGSQQLARSRLPARVVSGTFPSPAHAEGHGLAAFRRNQDLLRDRLVKVLYGGASLLYFMAESNEFRNLGKGLER